MGPVVSHPVQADDLLGVLTDPPNSDLLLSWLRRLRPDVGTRIWGDVEGLLTDTIDGAREGRSDASIRSRFRRAGVPSPHQWLRVRRSTAVLFRAQSGAVNLERAVMEAGYHDYSAFYRACRSLWGESPKRLTETLGWRRLWYHWLDREDALGARRAS